MIHVNLGPRSYDIAVNVPGDFAEFAATRLQSRITQVICDANVRSHAEAILASLNAGGFRTDVITIPPGEASKSLAIVSKLYEWLTLSHTDRQTAIIAVGGGMVGDLAGFVAATYNRGLSWIMAPTSLLAMVDSSVGGKVGVNLPQGKNLVGAFHQPTGVWINTAVLSSLPIAEFRSGLAEVVKYGVILDADFFAWLETSVDAILRKDSAAISHVVQRCCQLKAGIVERDEREETGQRMVLNYGHTFGHAFESVSGYAIRHGEAVAMGMVCASWLAERRGMINSETTQRLIRLLQRFGLPVGPPQPAQTDEWLMAMRRDKKAVSGNMRFVLPNRIGAVSVCNDVAAEDVTSVLASDAS